MTCRISRVGGVMAAVVHDMDANSLSAQATDYAEGGLKTAEYDCVRCIAD